MEEVERRDKSRNQEREAAYFFFEDVLTRQTFSNDIGSCGAFPEMVHCIVRIKDTMHW
jgi:hypothetical protein